MALPLTVLPDIPRIKSGGKLLPVNGERDAGRFGFANRQQPMIGETRAVSVFSPALEYQCPPPPPLAAAGGLRMATAKKASDAKSRVKRVNTSMKDSKNAC